MDTRLAHFQASSLKATKGGGAKSKGARHREKGEEAEGLADGLGMLWAARAKRTQRNLLAKSTARVAPTGDAYRADPTTTPPQKPSPPPSPPSSPPLLQVEVEVDAPPPLLSKSAARRSSSGEIVAASVRKLSRQMSSGSFAKLNGYDPEQTYAAGVSDAEAAAAAAAAEGEKLQPPAEAAHTAAQEELVT